MKKIAFLIFAFSLVMLDIYCTDATSDINKIQKELNDLNQEFHIFNDNMGYATKNIEKITSKIEIPEKNYLGITAIIISIFSALFTIVMSLILLSRERNLLFSKLVQEYSTNNMYDAIYSIRNFAKSIGSVISDKDSDNIKIMKKRKLIEEYIHLEKNKDNKTRSKEDKIKWYVLDFNRRLIANYFIKVFLFRSKYLIPKGMMNAFWSIGSLSFLPDYIIPLDYVAKPIIMKNIKPDDYYKEDNLMLVKYYNKYTDIKNKIDVNELKKLYMKIL